MLVSAFCGAKLLKKFVNSPSKSDKMNTGFVNSSAILEGLNEEQKKAVCCTDGPMLIVAGAGSGKTRVLTSRIAVLLAAGVEPWSILALTFTKKAAGEMKERIAAMVGDRRASRLVMGTFHAVFVRFLRKYAGELAYPSNFTICDTNESESVIKRCIKEMGLDDKIYKPQAVLSRISVAKNNLVSAGDYRASRHVDADIRAGKSRICDIYEAYQNRLKSSGVMDFDDILLNMNTLLDSNPAALDDISGRFRYIMVDEYQDTNLVQYYIVRKLASPHRNICVVGDDSQSIYAFRGARIENILNFKNDYPDCKVFRLERNYRSTSNIVDAANSLIAHNEDRIPKECYAVGEDGEKIHLIKSYSEQDEAMRVVSDIIGRIRSDRAQYSDFALLYRTNSQSRALEEQLRRRNIPYMIYSGNSFFDRMEVRDLMAYFKLCVNTSDDESFRRVVNLPARGIGKVTLQAIAGAAGARGISMFEAAKDFPKVAPFCAMISGLSALIPETEAHSMAMRIVTDSGLYAMYKADNSVEGQSRVANLDELLNSVAEFVEEKIHEAESAVVEGTDAESAAANGTDADSSAAHVVTLGEFLENVSLLSNVDVSDEDGNNKVALMTVHSAKGLEFKYVFVCGMEENLFPKLSLLSSKSDLEEERRLFYVAMTRAKQALTLTYALTRMRNGQHESNAPSRFLREVNSRYMESPVASSEGGLNVPEYSNFNGRRPGPSGSGTAKFRQSGTQGRTGLVPRTSTVSVRTGDPQSGRSVRPATSGRPPVIDPNFKAVPMTELKTGERVEHERFGAGTILELMGRAPDMQAVINFDDYGEKRLFLKYAKLRHARQGE